MYVVIQVAEFAEIRIVLIVEPADLA